MLDVYKSLPGQGELVEYMINTEGFIWDNCKFKEEGIHPFVIRTQRNRFIDTSFWMKEFSIVTIILRHTVSLIFGYGQFDRFYSKLILIKQCRDI